MDFFLEEKRKNIIFPFYIETERSLMPMNPESYLNFYRLVLNIDLSLNMDGKQISQVEKFTFLGLTINETVTWKDHIENIANRISKTLGILSRLKHTLPHKILKMIYTSLILPRLHYCNLAWGFRPGRIELLQKKGHSHYIKY